MADIVDTYLKLRAYELGRAVPRATSLQAVLQPQAWIFTPIEMAGEDATIHVVAFGRYGRRPRLAWVPDPRRREDQDRLFLRLHSYFRRDFESCQREGTFPQIVTASSAGAELIDLLADLLRFNNRDLRLRALGEQFAYFAQRVPIAGQQALLTATDLLSLHFATGQQDREDEHLLALLTWIDPPPGMSIWDAVAAAERVPMGINTDPNFDRATLERLVSAWTRARKDGEPETVQRLRRKAIRDALAPVVLPIYAATQRALDRLIGLGLPPLPDLAALADREAETFRSHMASRANGYFMPLRDQPKAAAFGLVTREEALSNLQAARLQGDGVAQVQGRLAGQIVTGVIENPAQVRVGTRQFAYRFELVSDQTALRVRVRDALNCVADPRLRVTVENVQRTGTTARIFLRLLRGQRSPGLPTAGQRMELTDQMPDWERLGRQRGKMSTCLMTTPWTHTAGPIPAATPPRGAPADALAFVDALRR